MKAYLWHEIENVSWNYHEEGSVLIEAETLKRAREIAFFKDPFNDDKLTSMEGIEREPDRIFDSDAKEEKVWVFPNAGCC